MNELTGKTLLITGATNGIGKAVSIELAKMGGTLVLVGRDPEKTRRTVEEIKSESGNSAIEGLIADLSSMADVRRLAETYKRKYSRLDVLVNDAGGIFATRQVTVDGYERTFATNHLAYFLLTNLLLEMLKASAPSRVINVSSAAHRGAELDFDDLQLEKNYSFGGMKAYSQSKLENLLFTYDLARGLAGTGVTVNAVHPGTVATGFGENNNGPMKVGMQFLHRFSLTPEQGADTVVYLASSPEVEGINGKYWVNRRQEVSSPASYDEEAQKRLWAVSEQLTGIAEPVHA